MTLNPPNTQNPVADRINEANQRLARIVHSGVPAPEWAPALFLLTGQIQRMAELGTCSDDIMASAAAVIERLLDGGEPLVERKVVRLYDN